MKIVKVTYTAKPEYVATNQVNIRKVMADLQQLNHPDIRYECFLAPDGCSFMHFAAFQQDEAQKVLNELESFRTFQEQLKAHGLQNAPQVEHLTMVGSSTKAIAQNE